VGRGLSTKGLDCDHNIGCSSASRKAVPSAEGGSAFAGVCHSTALDPRRAPSPSPHGEGPVTATARPMIRGSLEDLPPGSLLRAEEVARYLGCSARSIERAGVPAITITPRVHRYLVRDVLAWLERRRGAA